MSAEENALTAHLVCEEALANQNELLRQAADELQERFDIRHATLQCESRDFAASCRFNLNPEVSPTDQGQSE